MDTPCVKVCAIDPGSGTCTGCGRTLAEIAAWSAMTPDQRRRIMHELPSRPRPLAPPNRPMAP